jgi:alkylhydroperoxidase family enzyme
MSSHSALAKQKGATDAQVEGIKHFETAPFDEAQKLGFRAADRQHDSAHAIDDAFYAELKQHFNDKQLIELFAVAAAFEFFPRFVDSLRIPTTPLPGA